VDEFGADAGTALMEILRDDDGRELPQLVALRRRDPAQFRDRVNAFVAAEEKRLRKW
jgi:hypothetical protein